MKLVYCVTTSTYVVQSVTREHQYILNMAYAKFPNMHIRSGNPEHFKQDALDLAAKVRSDWQGADLRTKVFSDGISNSLIGIYKYGSKDDMVLVRVYGNNTEKFIDRDAELRNMELFNAHGCGSRIYAKFANGITYALIPGSVLTIDQVREPKIAKLVAETMAKVHKIHPDGSIGDESNKKSKLWEKMRQFLSLAPDGADGFEDPVMKKKATNAGVVSKAELEREISAMEAALGDCASPVVFCHNDLIFTNIILMPGGDEVRFIDYEYGMDNYQAFDIAEHFSEFVGVGGVLDYDKYYPDKVFQTAWIKHYLTMHNGKEPSDEDIEATYDLVCKFSLCSHLFWGIWSLLMARFSALDFDYIEFHCQRTKAYFDGKKKYMK